MKTAIIFFSTIVFMAVCSFSFLAMFTACTMSISNVDTRGTATDVVDSTPTTDAKVETSLPVSAIPAP